MVRHLGSFLLALVFGPAVFLLTGTGLSAFQTMWLEGGAASAVLDSAAALGALLLAGALYAVLTMARLSPVGPFLAGLGLLGMSVWGAAHQRSYVDTFAMLDVHMGGAVGQTGLGVLLAVPLLATVGSPRRWRKHEHLADETVALTPYPLQTGRPAQADATRQFTSTPGYTGLPDVPPPSLHYPRATPAGVPTVPTPPGPPAAAAPAAPFTAAKPAGDAPPLPRRNPAAATQSASAPASPPAAAPAPPARPAKSATPPAPPAAATPPQQPAVPPQRSAPPVATPAASPAAPPASQSPAPPPLPDEATVMLTQNDQATVQIDRD